MYIVRDEDSNRLFLYETFPEKYVNVEGKIKWRSKLGSIMELNGDLFPSVDYTIPVKVKIVLDT